MPQLINNKDKMLGNIKKMIMQEEESYKLISKINLKEYNKIILIK
jgi:hypothetical protein